MMRLFPETGIGVEKLELELGPLTAAAATRLVRDTLGAAQSHTMLARIVERADGNLSFWRS
jgi:hypothetical protein